MRNLILAVAAGAIWAVGIQRSEGATPSEQEVAALKEWSREISGAVVYTRNNRIRKVTLGESEPTDLGPGEFARWSRDGAQLAVYQRGSVVVMNANGSGRRTLVSGANQVDGAPVEFHTNGEEIIYLKRKEGFLAVHLTTGKTRKLNAPGEYSGEPCISANGSKMAARWDNDLYLIDLTTGTRRKFARGCSPGVSPSGELVMNNLGSHREMEIRKWDGSGRFRISAADCRPDQQWDNHHWSNHEDYITAKGEKRGNNIYVVNVPRNQGLRVSWESGESPDAFIVAKGSARETKTTTSVSPPPAPANAFVSKTLWPGNHAALAFLWQNAEAANEILDAKGAPLRSCRVLPMRAARYGQHYDMDLSGGAFMAEGVDTTLLAACRSSGELALELVFTPADPALYRSQEPGRLVAFSRDASTRNFALTQTGDELQLHLSTAGERRRGASPPVITLGQVEPGRSTHLIVTYRDGELVCYRNGKPTVTSGRLRGDFSDWAAMSLVFGDEKTGGRNWAGSLEGVAIYSRFIPAAEAGAKYQFYAQKLERKPLPRLAVTGVLLDRSVVPDPASIHPYRRALVVNTYRIGVAEARPSTTEKIQVAQWGVLDAQISPSVQSLKIGQSYSLVLEPFEKHPQLESERVVSSSEEFNLPLYYDLRPEVVVATDAPAAAAATNVP